MEKLKVLLVIFICLESIKAASINLPSKNINEYNRMRLELIERNQARGLGFDEPLSNDEWKLNKIIMDFKRSELDEGFLDPLAFSAAQHHFEVIDKVKNSPLFQILKRMPKGAVLHAHDTALASSDFVVTLTYRDNLWQCGSAPDIKRFLFSVQRPSSIDCTWYLVTDERRRLGAVNYDKVVKRFFTLFVENPSQVYPNINYIWAKFEDIFVKLGPIVTYVPVWKAYFYQSLLEFYQDGVTVLEFRGVLPELYDLTGRKYSPIEAAEFYYSVLQQFKRDYPGFSDCKFIYAPHRFVDDNTFDSYIPIMRELQRRFPDFVVGFDLVGQEDLGRPLKDFAERLLELRNVTFYFHAGETNWNGMSSDENMVDAILLNTKRIGHGYALTKYPALLELVKQRDICIEVNPLSNQILKLVEDYRNHPAHLFLADNYPVVITSDNPSFWEATPLTHDLYFAFMGIASAHQDLRTLKRLIRNSITYSSLNDIEKEKALFMWTKQWEYFVSSSI